MTVLATYRSGQALLTVLEFGLLFLWIWIAIGVIADIFRSHDMSSCGKAAWLILAVLLPLLGVLIYLIARGHKMAEHAVSDTRAQDAAFRQYVRSAAVVSDDIAKLDDLRNRGVLSEEESRASRDKARVRPPGGSTASDLPNQGPSGRARQPMRASTKLALTGTAPRQHQGC